MSYLLIIVAIIPVALILYYVNSKDKNKEPIKLLVELFLAGAFSCFLVICVSSFFAKYLPFMNIDTSSGDNTFLDVFLYSFIGVALIEELCKFLMTYLIGYRNREFEEIYDMVVYAIFVALGFACLENILYVTSSGLRIGILRGFTAVPGHACDGLFMGYYLSYAKLYSVNGDKLNETENILKAMFIPVLLHGIYDFCCFYTNKYINIIFIVFIVTLYIMSIDRLNKTAKKNRKIGVSPNKVSTSSEKVSTQGNIEAVKVTGGNSNPINNSTDNINSKTSIVSNGNNNQDYFKIDMKRMNMPNRDSSSDNFVFDNQTVPYVPNSLLEKSVLDHSSFITNEFSADYISSNDEVGANGDATIQNSDNKNTNNGTANDASPIPELSYDNLKEMYNSSQICVYCGAVVHGEVCESCGHKVKR